MAGKFAKNTHVSIERSQEQIKSVLRKYEADGIGTWEERGKAAMQFIIGGLKVHIEVSLPLSTDTEFHQTDTGRERGGVAAHKAYEQAVRQRWRALLLAIQAKLEAVETGISTLEKEFLSYIVLGDGQTVGDHLLPGLAAAAEKGIMPKQITFNGKGSRG